MPRVSSAAPSLALPRSDYPHKAKIAAIPATNAQANRLLGPAHRSSFDRLQRVDALGWLQAAQWYFNTGRGRAKSRHLTIFGYGINVFRTQKQAKRVLRDVKLKTRPFRISRLPARLYRSSDVHETLVFTFFVYRTVEVEAYYQYMGVAPTRLAKKLWQMHARQAGHLAGLARTLHRKLHQAPLPTPTPTHTPIPTSTPRPTETPTAPPTPTSIPSPTATMTPAATPTPNPTPTATPSGFVVKAGMSDPTYQPGQQAVVNVQVSQNGEAVQGAKLTAQFNLPAQTLTCTATTDVNGLASCGQEVPALPGGSLVLVALSVRGPNGELVETTVAFTVQEKAP